MAKNSPVILDRTDPILRRVAESVDFKKIGAVKLKKILADMRAALESQDDGVAIAAPQIGLPLRIFMVSDKVYEMGKISPKARHLVFINPRITRLSKQRNMVEEGCLSVRWLYGKVSRSVKATIEAEDEEGKPFTLGASGLLAQVFQHETDHLDGILFIDKAVDLEEIPPEETEHDHD